MLRRGSNLNPAFLLVVYMHLIESVAQPDCPKPCTCQNTSSGTRVTCVKKGLAKVPENLPKNTSSLFLSKNFIQTLGPNLFLGLSKLVLLDLQHNRISNVSEKAFLGLSSLQKLLLDSNRLYRIPDLGHSPRLKTLSLSQNLIQSATFPSGFAQVTGLSKVNLAGNLLGKILSDDLVPLSNANVRSLHISSCRISEMENRSLSPVKATLQSLHMSNNPLNADNLANLMQSLRGAKQLQTLKLNALGGITHISPDVFGPLAKSPIRVLSLAGTHLGKLELGTFSRPVRRLLHIDLSRCKIDTLEDDLTTLTRLKFIGLCRNFLSAIPKLPSALAELRMSQNRIRHVDADVFAGAENLRILDLSGNHITQLVRGALDDLPGLSQLDLSSNDIPALPSKLFAAQSNLTQLNLRHNHLVKITQPVFEPLVNLKRLDLSNQRDGLAVISDNLFSGLSGLEFLDLSQNGLKLNIDKNIKCFRGLKRLKRLQLSGNSLESLSSEIFADLPRLEELELSRNNLRHWEGRTFSELRTLKRLNLSSNLVSLVNSTSVQGWQSLEWADLRGNPFNCWCELRWFREQLNSSKLPLVRPEEMSCNSPSRFQGRRLIDFHTNDIAVYLHCLPKFVYVLGGCVVGFVVLGVVALLMYRRRWWLRFKIYRCGRTCCKNSGRDQYRCLVTDADEHAVSCYLSTHPDDKEFVEEILKPTLQQHSLTHFSRLEPPDPSMTVFRSIEQHMDARQFIVILSQSYVKDRFCEFELEQILAGTFADFTTPRFLFIDLGVPGKSIPPKLLRIFLAKLQLTWPADEHGRELCEKQLTERLLEVQVTDSATA